MTRNDLPNGIQLAQSCHAAFQFANEHANITNNWMHNSNYICCLSVNDEEGLCELIKRAKKNNIRFSVFREPDIENKITAIVLEPSYLSKRLCSELKLALKF